MNDSMASVSSTLDLCGLPCPINFIRAKVSLEQIASGSLCILMDDAAKLKSVRHNLKEEGYAVGDPEPVENYFKFTVRKV